MRTTLPITLLIALAGLAATASAQDSTSTNSDGGNGLPGDALNPLAAGATQRATYILDLAPITTSRGTLFGLGPVAKSGRVNTTRFNAYTGPSSISASLKLAAPFPSATYARWTAATAGVNAAQNNTALNTAVTPAGTASVFALGLLDFDEVTVSATPVFANQVVGCQVAFDPALPGRLYVTRTVAAINAAAGAQDVSQFGYGAVDADGNITFRADGFGVGGTTNPLQGDNFFRVRLPQRSTATNLLNNNGVSNSSAASWLLVRSTVTHAVPTAIPADLAGRSVLLGADLLGQYRYEQTAGATITAITHRPSTTDHRAGPAFSAAPVFAGSVGTAGILTRSGAAKTDSISLWGVAPDGSVVLPRTITLPASLTDACDPFAWPVSGGELRHYDSQVTFRGGSGPVALGKDAAGRALAAAVVSNGTRTGASNPYNAVAVARFDPAVPGSPVTWRTAAWVDPDAGDGKDITGDYGADGAPGTFDAGEGDGVVDALDAPIGRLASLTETPFEPVGPSLSAPAFDSAGNVYFIASASFREKVGVAIVNEYRVALFRAIYDPAAFCYRLESVLEPGQVVTGANSAVPYLIQSLSLGDGDSISSSALWSGSVTQQPWNRTDTSGLPTDSPLHLGGLVVSARILYNVNGGAFADPTELAGDPTSPDEAYNAVLYLGNITLPTTTPTCGSTDFDGDGDDATDADIEAFFSVIGGSGCPTATCGSTDFDGDGDEGTDADIEAFFRVIGGGPCEL